jgi:hypothetical protein
MRFSQLIFPDIETFRHAIESPRAPWLVTGILIGLGTVFGVLVAAFQQAIGGTLAGIPIDRFGGFELYFGNVLAHILIVLACHVGVTIVAWLMAKAVGGPGHLAALYRTTAYLLPLLLPALPYVAAQSAAASLGGSVGEPPLQGLLLPLAGLGAALGLSGLYALFRDVQDRSPPRAAFATAGFVVFVAAVLIVA